VDRGGDRLAIYGADGSPRGTQLESGWGAGQLRYPGGICIDARGYVYVADRENDRVQVLQVAE
ncbi:MAG TPA: hypothetical protein VJS92_07000, partial [Candidatus Polarisedimenticolaceae bacterium]|nr:hypothetical protein [Candidatus Polarisedimenticolaceae bacterium]